MKKAFALFLALCMVAALTAALVVTSSADETEVTVGQQLSYNQAAKEDVVAWRTSNLSPDGMWKYMFYVPNKNAYKDMVICRSSGNYSWDGSTSTGTGPLDYILVRQNGLNFHPGKAGDVCKVFIVPVSGHITLETTIARQTEFTSQSSGTPTGYAVWLEDKQIYPTDGSEYEAFTSTTPRTVSVETDVIQGQYLYIRISSIDGQNGADGINMENFITYSSIDTSGSVFTGTRTSLNGNNTWTGGSTVTIPSLHGSDAPTTNNGGQKTTNNSSSSKTGLIIGIVAGVVVIAAAAAAVVIVKKKKSAE